MDIDYRSILDRLISMLSPHRCMNCGDVVYYEDIVCEKCDFERAEAESCLRKLHDVPVSGAVAGSLFTGHPQKAVYVIKDKQDVHIRDFFAQRMYEEINENWTDSAFDFVTSVPSSPEYMKTRVFNQAEMLAKKLAKRLRVPYVDGALAKDNAAQVEDYEEIYKL